MANPLEAVCRFARGRKIPERVAVAVYDGERQRLAQGAKVERFLDVLAEKRARRVLKDLERRS